MSSCCPPPDPGASAPLDDAEGVRIARALGHPVRVRLLRLLGEADECFCGDLCEAFDLAQSTVSQHLKVLGDAGLIRGARVGTATCYCVEDARIAAFHAWVAGLPGAHLQGPPAPSALSASLPHDPRTLAAS